MKSLDVLLLLGTIFLALCFIFIPKRISGIFKTLLALIIMLAIVQFLFEGYYWQFIPCYVLILFLMVWAFFFKETNRDNPKKPYQILMVILILAAIFPWTIFLPIPKLTEPQGSYIVGTRIFRWVDLDRDEQITSDPNDKRNVIVQAWYPAVPEAEDSHSVYLDGLEDLPKKIVGIPAFLFGHFDQIETYGKLDAPLSKAENQWPVILFLAGNGASRAFYTSIATGLASFGYVVLTIDHPYEAAITQLSDGRNVTPIEIFLEDDPDLLKFMKARLDLRVEDIQFVINQISNPKGISDNFFLFLDQNQIGIAGHSLGGASAALAMALDPRIKAAANIDGTLYGDLPKRNGPRPFLVLESKKDDRDRFIRYETGNELLFKQFAGGYRYEILKADHYSFTDAPLWLAYPARFLAGNILGFGNIPKSTHHATVAILNAFFLGALNGKPSDLDSIANRYEGIIRKPID